MDKTYQQFLVVEMWYGDGAVCRWMLAQRWSDQVNRMSRLAPHINNLRRWVHTPNCYCLPPQGWVGSALFKYRRRLANDMMQLGCLLQSLLLLSSFSVVVFISSCNFYVRRNPYLIWFGFCFNLLPLLLAYCFPLAFAHSLLEPTLQSRFICNHMYIIDTAL
jgi:hypothetical protein